MDTTNFKVGDKVRSIFPYTMDDSERFYRLSHGMVGKVTEVETIFVRVRFDSPVPGYSDERDAACFFPKELELLPKENIRAVDMEIGQIGRIVADEKYSGKHVGDVILRIYGEKFVSLNDPISTWDTYVTFSVLPFNKGETFEVVSK